MAEEQKFYQNFTYEEWSSSQDQNGLEFKMVDEIHKVFPFWNLDDIKEYGPGFMSTFLKMMQDIHKDNRDYSIEAIKNKMLDYVDSGRRSDKIHMQVFGVPCSASFDLARWNSGLIRIMTILTSPSKYKHEDFRGHASVHAARLGERNYSFRSEMQLDRDIQEIVQLNQDRYPTKSDFIREIVFKGVEIYTLLNKEDLGPIAKQILLDLETNRKQLDKQKMGYITENIRKNIEDYYDDLDQCLRWENNKGALEDFRNEFTDYLREVLSRPGNVRQREAIRHEIKENRDLSRILSTLEKEEMVSKEYVDSILKKGVAIPFVGSVAPVETFSDDDLKENNRR